MATLTTTISNALAPGVALTSGILYYASLQTRLHTVSGRARDLNREARALAGDPSQAERLASVVRQVEGLTLRAIVLRRSVLCAYGALFGFIFTILELLVLGILEEPGSDTAPMVTFSAALVCLVFAMVISAWETFLATRTLSEDMRSSLPGHENDGP